MVRMKGFGLRDQALERLYGDVTGPVAFIDESYREPLSSNERPFYMMSAVLIGPTQGELVRDVLMDIPGTRYWHTTEAYRSESGRPIIGEMINYLAESIDYNIITVQTEVRRDDPGMKRAREESLTALAKEVTRGSGESAVRLLVAESRNSRIHPGGDNADAQVIKRMRSAGVLDRTVNIHHTSPGKEPLLWAADLSAWAYRRQIAVGDTKWFEPLEDISTVLHVNGTDVSVKRSNPHLPQPSPGVQPTVGHERLNNQGIRAGGPVVASPQSLVFGGAESEPLARIRAIVARTGRTVEQEIVLAVGTDDPRRLIAAANEYLHRATTDPGRTKTVVEESLKRGAETILPSTSAEKVKAAIAGLRQRQNPDSAPSDDIPSPTKDRRQGYQR